MKHEYLNEYNPDHFWTQRRSMPPWHPPTPALDADKVVFIIVMLIALIALLGVWASEGGL
jgi:hypothetical protein